MMEGTRTMVAVVAEAVATLEEGLGAVAAVLEGADLLALERCLQQVLRAVGSVLVSGILNQRAQGPAGEATSCPRCGRRLHLVGRERQRTVLGLVGEYRLGRPAFSCAQCHAGHVPLDDVLGLGAARLSPALAAAVCHAAQQGSFTAASQSVQRSVGVYVDAETIRRLAEAVGQLLEHEQADRPRWAVPPEAVPARLLVAVDGVHAPLRDGYHEAKVGRVGALGPAQRVDPATGRALFVLGDSTFCVGLESGEAFFPRLTREAWRAGFTRGVRQVVCLGDGARWIWQQMRTQFSQPGVEVVEIVDVQHASAHLAEVATAVFGEGALPARSWWAAHQQALLRQGPAPILAALAALLARPDLAEEARAVVRRNLEEYFTDNRARMDYPAFVARALPIGSGAVESACKTLISQRHKGAGMRWTREGAQQIANLRALAPCAHGRWDTFWASRPLPRLRTLPAPGPAAPSTLTPAVQPPADTPPRGAPPPAMDRTRIATAGKPWAKGQGYWARAPISHPRSA